MGEKPTPYMHVVSQATYHAEAEIVGTTDALAAVSEALNSAISHRDAEVILFASDGEGYRLKIRRSDRIADLGEPFYIDDVAREIAAIERDFIVSHYKLLKSQNEEAMQALKWCRANGNPHQPAQQEGKGE